jgi:hypothetical protein
MRVKIYQIDSEKDEHAYRFAPLSYVEKRGGVDPNIYKQVYYGDIDVNNLESLYIRLNEDDRPPLYQGTSLSVSDVVEVFDSEDSNADSKCFYVDSVGYKELDNFDTSLCEEMYGEKAVYITPHHTPLVLNMHINDYKDLSAAVGGLIELTHPFNDEACVIGNDEAKLIGMDGNRKIGQSIYAGPILIVGDNGDENFIPLTDKQVDFYADKFKEIENISEEEVQSDMYCTFIPLEMN